MALLGFNDIRTFECLNRQMENAGFAYNSIYPSENDGKIDQKLYEHDNISKETIKNKRKAKAMGKFLAPVSSQQGVMRGHTGYLTFATKF
jgi:hypothetical protein